MIFNPEKEKEKLYGKTLSYSQIGKMLLTNKRIYGGFRKKMDSKFNEHIKTSNDNILSKQYNKAKKTSPTKIRQTPSNAITTSRHKNPIFGGDVTIPQFHPVYPPQPSIEMVQAFDRQHTLPSDRCIQSRRRYVRNDTFSIAHSSSHEKRQTRESNKLAKSKNMRQLLEYRFASHSCELVSPKITQSTPIKISK